VNYLTIFVVAFLLFTTSTHAKPCVFCTQNIVQEQSVFEGRYFYVLLDHEPRVPGHLLVIPKRHVAKAHDLSQNEWSELSDLLPKIVAVFCEFLETEDYILLEKNGQQAFQQIPHVHFHLFPVHKESWSEIFDIVPAKLNREDLAYQILVFRNYFISNN